MYLEQQRILATHVRAFLREKYDVDLPNIVIDQPPKVEMGEFAMPFSFELAKRLRKAPRQIAQDIVELDAGARGLREVRGRRRRIHQRPPEARRSPPRRSLADKDERSGNARRRRRGRRQRQDPGRAHVDQSQQGRAHRTPAQRHPRRHLRSSAARRRTHGRRAELHRQHRRAGGRRGGRLRRAGEENEGAGREPDRADAAVRLLLLGPLRARFAVVRGRQGAPEGAGQRAARHRAGRQRDGGDRRDGVGRGAAPASADDGPARHRIRLPAARERDPAPAFLGCGVRAAESRRACCTSRTRGRTRAAG